MCRANSKFIVNINKKRANEESELAQIWFGKGTMLDNNWSVFDYYLSWNHIQ